MRTMRHVRCRPKSRTRADAAYNIGNAWLKAQQPQKAIQSYVDGLKLNPDDQEAKYNLSAALRMLQQQQQQQQQQKNQQNKQQKDKQNKDQQNQQNQQQQQNKDKQQQQQQRTRSRISSNSVSRSSSRTGRSRRRMLNAYLTC